MTSPSTFRKINRTGVSFAIVACGVVLLAGCATSSTDATNASSEPSAASDTGMPEQSGVSGLIASIADGVLQVQGADEQNAVAYDDDTTVSETVDADISSVITGSCVVVTGSADEETEAVTAESITVSEAVDGECTGGFGGGGAGTPPGDAGDGDGEMPERPSDAPTDGTMPSDGSVPSGAPMGGGMVVGLVSAVDGDTFTVESSFGDDDATQSVLTTSDTTVTATVASDDSALETGRCVVVEGEADDAGTVAATALTVSDAIDGECSTGMRGGFGGQPGSESGDE